MKIVWGIFLAAFLAAGCVERNTAMTASDREALEKAEKHAAVMEWEEADKALSPIRSSRDARVYDVKAAIEKGRRVAAERAARNAKLSELHAQRPHVGMTADDVRQSQWGYPQSVQRTETAHAVVETWIYGTDRYVFLTNGMVTSVHTTQ